VTGFLVLSDLLTDFVVRNENVRLLGLIVPQQVKIVVLINVQELVFGTSDGRSVYLVARRGVVFHFLAGENVDGDQTDFGVAVFVLGKFDLDDLAGTPLDDDVAKANKLFNREVRSAQ